MNLWPTITSEWLKLRSVRSTIWTIGVTVALCVGLGALVTWAARHQWQQSSLQEHLAFDPLQVSLVGFFFAPLAMGVVGVLIISSEFSSGSIRATLAAQPRRVAVLLAKAVVLGVTALVVGEVCAFASFGVGMSILHGVTPTASLGSPGVLRALLLAGVSLSLLSLLALGIAAMVRHTAGSITVYVTLLLVLVIIVAALPTDWGAQVARYLPEVLAESMRSTSTAGTQAPVLSPGTSTLVLAAYALASLIAGGVALTRRDA